MVAHLKFDGWLLITFFSISLVISPVYSSEGHISLIDYRDSEQLLSVNIVAPTTGGGKIYLNTDGILSELSRFTRVGEHKLVIHLPCNEFKEGDSLLYKVGDVTLSLPLNRIFCTSNSAQRQQPRIIYNNVGCIIEPKGTTLWRVGSLLAEKNGYSVYQNMYAVFLSNRQHFVDDDITRMQDNLLICPLEETIASIDKRHAVDMFREAETFRLASNMQEGAPAGNEETNAPDDEGKKLAQVISPVKTVVEQAADTGLLATVATDRDAADNGLAADANTGADEKSEDAEQLAQLIASFEVSNDNRDNEVNGTGRQHPIIDKTQAAISDDIVALPKLVSEIDGAKSAGPLNIVPGCYIEPNHKTLWSIGVVLKKLNGHSVYQNMYAVFAVNPKAFPSDDVNHMLNQKLNCPTAYEVSSRTTKESQHLLKQRL